MNTGVPLVTHQPRDPVAKQLRRIQTSYQGAAQAAPRKHGRRKVVAR
jgi:pilus assembly protein CpaE